MADATQSRRASAIEALQGQTIELPSWAFGNSGTRFKVFAQQGVPRDPFEKVADAATVNRFTGVAPSVALHVDVPRRGGQRQRGPMERTPRVSTARHGFGGGRRF